MTLDEFIWMRKLFETRNMSKAAEALFVTQPALSHCVKRIEQQLGFSLFSRSNKGLVPTEKGNLFFEMTVRVTEAYHDFEVKARLADCMELRQITIGMPPFLSVCLSAEVMEQLRDAFPDLEISVQEGSWDILLQDLRSNKIQLAITTGPIFLKDLKVHSFGRGRMVIMLRKNSPIQQYTYTHNGIPYLDPAYLAEEPLAMTKPGQATRRLAEALVREAGVEPHIQMESKHIETLYKYAEKGIATAVIPLMAVDKQRNLQNRLMYYIPENYKHASICACIAMLPQIDRVLPPKLLTIIEENVINSNHYIAFRENSGV